MSEAAQEVQSAMFELGIALTKTSHKGLLFRFGVSMGLEVALAAKQELEAAEAAAREIVNRSPAHQSVYRELVSKAMPSAYSRHYLGLLDR